MAKVTQRLSARSVSTITKPGMHSDGDGLYLVVGESGAKRWSYVFQWDKKRKEMGLGNLASVTLAEAREKAKAARKVLSDGDNPIASRDKEKADRKAAAVTFGTFADAYVKRVQKDFKNPKHQAQWKMTLEVYAAPLRPKRLDEITTEDILAILEPIWMTKNETASRLRGRIERVLSAAKVKGLRSGENPALWRGHLDELLSRKKPKVKHHAALPYKQMPEFMPRLAMSKGMGAKALQVTILSASRTGETRFATKPEFDLDAAVWTVPEGRMKGEREHRVPLPKAAVAILRELFATTPGDLVFPGLKPGRPISEATMTKAMKTAGGVGATVHGFRSSFKDWATEETNFAGEISEAALSHLVGDETERAYKRGDVLAKRRKLMEAWSLFCTAPPTSNVVALPRNRSA